MKPLSRFAHVRSEVAHAELTRPRPDSPSGVPERLRGQPSPLTRPNVTQIYEAHGSFVWASLHRMGVRSADVPDLSQEVFLIVHRRLSSWDGETRITTWLFGICLKVAAAYRRRAWFRRERHVETDAPTGQATPEEQAVLSDAQGRLALVLDGLASDQRALFVMFEFEDKSCAEIAELFGVPVGTVHSRLHAARKDFQKSLSRVEARALGLRRGVSASFTSARRRPR
jgi:RNA polymerase sigma-70 factor (ECF subfamily)